MSSTVNARRSSRSRSGAQADLAECGGSRSPVWRMRPSWTKAALVSLLGGLLIATTASAQNYSFLRNTPISHFNAADMRLYTDAARRALEAPELGLPVRWKNEKSGSQGSVTATAGTREGCRTLTVETGHKTLTARNGHHVCRVEGQWKAEH